MRLPHSGISLHAVDCGSGVPLLLVHGFPLDHTMWGHQIDFFSTRCRVIAPDLRAFGQSTGATEKTTMAQFADDLAELLDALGVNRPVIFCGLSMGGYVAFQFWQRHRHKLRALILCDTRAVADTAEAAAIRLAMADRVLAEGPQFVAEAMLPRLFAKESQLQKKPEIEEMRRTILATSPAAIAAAQRGMADRPDMTDRLGEIDVPTLVIVGAGDVISPPSEMQAMAAAIPMARFCVVPGAGHMSPLENPTAFNAALATFLSEFN